MKKTILLLGLTGVLALGGCVKKKEITYVSDEALIRQQIQTFEKALRQREPMLLADYYARDQVQVYSLQRSEKLTGWEDVMDYWKKFLKNYPVSDFSINSLTISPQGRRAWVNGDWQMTVEKKKFLKKDSKVFTVIGRYTAILENREGSWQVIHEHMSVPDFQLAEK